MNDYRLIQWKAREHWKLRPEDTIEMYKAAVRELHSEVAATDRQVIVVTHHAPSKESTHPKYRDDYHMNGGYSSNLIGHVPYGRIPLWIHGHTHDSFDYTDHGVRVVANPRGYVTALVEQAENPVFDVARFVELP